MSMRLFQNCGMKTMDEKLKKHIEGLKPNQIRLLASIYAGLAERLRRRKVNASLTNWKRREDHIWN